jgi:DNA (cytosine-5)-methyltransferase 1
MARGDRLTLFPTPTARDWKGGTNPLGRPPRADNGRIRGEGDYSVVDAIGALPEGCWGKYEPAVRIWESILGRPGPTPGEPNRNGKPRVRPAFSEWLMGWPAGHVTSVDGISRNDQLRIIGNGVVPQQAEAAIRWLLNVSEAVA